jgi:hypothetical protein
MAQLRQCGSAEIGLITYPETDIIYSHSFLQQGPSQAELLESLNRFWLKTISSPGGSLVRPVINKTCFNPESNQIRPVCFSQSISLKIEA